MPLFLLVLGTAVDHSHCLVIVHRSRVQLLDRSGLALASQNALSLQYVLEGGSSSHDDRACLRILPLLNEVRRSLWVIRCPSLHPFYPCQLCKKKLSVVTKLSRELHGLLLSKVLKYSKRNSPFAFLQHC